MPDSVKKKNSVRAAKAIHEKKSKERAGEAQTLKAQYLQESDSPVLQDILAKARSFADYHTKLARDGVGYRNTGARLEDGSVEQELFFFDPAKRVSELDKAAGILELVDYVERQLVVPSTTVAVKKDSEDIAEEPAEEEAKAE
jgi:hypothetical protein